nr:hypothetical protein [Burkholderiales bacterium]
MEDFRFINATKLGVNQLLKIAQLLMEAEYPENPPLEYYKFITFATENDKLHTIKPYVDYTHVLMSNNDIVGCCVVSNRHQAKKISNNISGWRSKDPEVISCLEYYVNETLDSDFILQYITID